MWLTSTQPWQPATGDLSHAGGLSHTGGLAHTRGLAHPMPRAPAGHRAFLLGRPARSGRLAVTDPAVGTVRRTPKMARLEAVLLMADAALSTRRLAHLATLAAAAETRSLVETLNESYEHCGSAFRIERVATGYQLLTRPEFALWLDRLHNRQSQLKLSTPALETLSIIAYRQPITRADIEAIRGVQSTDILKHLMERGLARIGGEEDTLGRPYLYETTRRFLELFGLRGLDDLPNSQQLATPADPGVEVEVEEENEVEEIAVDEAIEEDAEVAEEEDADEEDEDDEDDY